MSIVTKFKVIFGYFIFLILWIKLAPKIPSLANAPQSYAWLPAIFPFFILLVFTIIAVIKFKEG